MNLSLRKIALDTIQIAKDFSGAALKGLDTYCLSWLTALDLFSTQIGTLEATLELLDKSRYKECFVLLRSVLEGSFFLRLLMNGKTYREVREVIITPVTSPDVKTARDRTITLWRRIIKSDPAKAKWQLAPKGDDIIVVTEYYEGLFDSGGGLVTRYYFAYDEYDPIFRFTADLQSVRELDKIPDSQTLKDQKRYYHQYFYFGKLVANLKLNCFLTDVQSDYFQVHYSFLSAYVHPTGEGTPIRAEKDFPGDKDPPPSGAYKELVLSYVCHIFRLLLQWTIEFAERINPKIKLTRYKSQLGSLLTAAQDVWFIYNKPTKYDVERSTTMKPAAPHGIWYPPNPLLRLIEMRRHTKTDYKR